MSARRVQSTSSNYSNEADVYSRTSDDQSMTMLTPSVYQPIQEQEWNNARLPQITQAQQESMGARKFASMLRIGQEDKAALIQAYRDSVRGEEVQYTNSVRHAWRRCLGMDIEDLSRLSPTGFCKVYEQLGAGDRLGRLEFPAQRAPRTREMAGTLQTVKSGRGFHVPQAGHGQ